MRSHKMKVLPPIVSISISINTGVRFDYVYALYKRINLPLEEKNAC